MNVDRYQKAKAVFYSAWSAAPHERAAVLDRACGEDSDLRLEVEKLLKVNETQSKFLQRPIMDGEIFREGVALSMSDQASVVALPATIGRYRIIRLVGEGGMGTVYEAEQESPQRRVALKVIRPLLNSRAMIQRFEHEVKILGRLQHPGIAQIFEAGIANEESEPGSAQRRPYFAMEFVDGMALTAFASHNNLSLNDRLDLLMRVCEAVQYGHERGVIHRDLKPANILVCADGSPKVIDFGVARATEVDPMLTMHTEAGQMLGTLTYMSPEQVSGQPDAVDARSDVYSLGVIGYELLSGRLPYDLTGKVAPEAARIICDSEPSSLSSISRNYRGDIETIVGKAIEKDPKRRYQSAAELAADLQRYLRDEPILARPPSMRYQVGKFARRHKELVAGLVLVFLVLIGGIIATGAALVRARVAERNALQEAARARMLNEWNVWMLSFAKPGMAEGGRDVKVVDMLDAASARLEDQLKDAPDVEMQVRQTIADSYRRLGLKADAAREYDRALQLAKQIDGEYSAEALKTIANLAMVAPDLAQSEAQVLLALEHARTTCGPNALITQRLLFSLGIVRMHVWDAAAAVPVWRELLDITKSVPEDQRFAPLSIVTIRLASALRHLTHFEEAEGLAQEVMEMPETTSDLGLEHEISARSVLAGICEEQGRLDEAEKFYRQLLEAQQASVGNEHVTTGLCRHWLSDILVRRQRWTEALELLDEEEAVGPSRLRNEDYRAYLQGYRRSVLTRLGRYVDANEAATMAISIRRTTTGDDWFAQQLWREAVVDIGLRCGDPWGSETMQTHLRQSLRDRLRANPTSTFGLDEIQWEQLRYTLTHWSGNSGTENAETEVSNGGLNELMAMADPPPGVYRLAIEIPRSDLKVVTCSDWMLFTPWQIEVQTAPRYVDAKTRSLGPPVYVGPREHRTSSALDYMETYDEGFGPQRSHLRFELNGETIVEVPPGSYHLIAHHNDGMRAWLNDALVIDNWTDGTHRDVVDITLGAGPNRLRVAYFQHGVDARLSVHIEPTPSSVRH